jgi:hypothetical protein
MKNIAFALIINLLGTISSLAQQVIERPQLFKRPSPYERYTTYRISLTGGLGLPMGTFKNYMTANTLHNYALSADFVFPNNNFSAGIIVGSQFFQNRLPRQVYPTTNGAISAVQTRTFSAYPLIFTGSYHFAKVNATIRPYVQVGAGGVFASLTNYWGNLPTGKNGLRIALHGGAGVRALLGKSGHFGVEAGISYQHVPFKAASEGITDASSFSARAGLFYRWW